MSNKLIALTIFLVAFTFHVQAQSIDNLKEINKVWEKFYKAFDSLDHQFMAEIHSKKLIRISGGKRISDYETYIKGYERRFKKAKENKTSNTISLRFFERVNNDSIASERGIYKLIRIEKDKKEQVYYGQFHVLFIKEHDEWKILMDYDSNEGNSIGEKEYRNAHGINQFDKFIKN